MSVTCDVAKGASEANKDADVMLWDAVLSLSSAAPKSALAEAGVCFS